MNGGLTPKQRVGPGHCVPRAQVLSDSEKEAVWPDVRAAIPQMNVYETRTDRNIRVFRLSRAGR